MAVQLERLQGEGSAGCLAEGGMLMGADAGTAGTLLALAPADEVTGEMLSCQWELLQQMVRPPQSGLIHGYMLYVCIV